MLKGMRRILLFFDRDCMVLKYRLALCCFLHDARRSAVFRVKFYL